MPITQPLLIKAWRCTNCHAEEWHSRLQLPPGWGRRDGAVLCARCGPNPRQCVRARIVDYMRGRGEAHYDHIARTLGLNSSHVCSECSKLVSFGIFEKVGRARFRIVPGAKYEAFGRHGDA